MTPPPKPPTPPGSRRGAAPCAVCGIPSVREVSIPADPRAHPGLPEALRGKAIPVCEAFDCLGTAKARAQTAAMKAGVVLTHVLISTLTQKGQVQ